MLQWKRVELVFLPVIRCPEWLMFSCGRVR
jgi:hypothetical protein